MDKSLHSLICSSVNFFESILKIKLLNSFSCCCIYISAKLFKFSFLIAIVITENRINTFFFPDFISNFIAYFLTIVKLSNHLKATSDVVNIFLAICFLYAFSHCILKVRHTLTAVLVILIRLNCDTSECRIAVNIVWFTKETMTCRKAILKKLDEVDLTASCCKCKVVQIVDMNISLIMSLCMLRIENIHFIELLCTFGAIFKHSTHSCISIDIRIFALDITILGCLKSKVFVHLHKLGIHFTCTCS